MASLRAFMETIRGRVMKYVYRYYERKLLAEVKRGRMPEHVGLILDGNRRWAMEVGLTSEKGHEYGFEKLKEVLNWCWELGIHVVTIYALSTENLQRDKREVENLLRLAKKGFSEVLNSPEIHRYRVRVKVIGRLDLLDEDLRELIMQVEKLTEKYNDNKIYVAIAYGGRMEIVDATKRIIRSVLSGELRVEEIDENTFSKYLYTNGDKDPDLIIRTSGEERLSGFLLWQSAYSEFYFMDVYWPALRKIDLLRAIRTYQRRNRRFGK
ncbi:MAG: di-trans,poly-cis-decaprenylcistransferase [Candidatus Methanomethyliales bacterium]|nr:di-trans,poly-cis-decaprenylcistransferase [Candidatus Methanomethylicales archaeon]